METLSDKMDYANDYETGCPRKVFYKRDVKDFIKQLKEEFLDSVSVCTLRSSEQNGVLDVIDKLAGDKLI